MQERQQLEMARMCENVGFAFTNKDVTELASKQLIDVEVLRVVICVVLLLWNCFLCLILFLAKICQQLLTLGH